MGSESLLPLPPMPAFDAAHDPMREQALIGSIREIAFQLQRIDQFLSRFEPVIMVDSDGQRLEALCRRLGSAEVQSSASHPWRLVDATEPNGSPRFTVSEGGLFSDMLDADSRIPVSNDDGTFDAQAGHWLFIECEVDSGEVTGAQMKCEASWPEYPKLYKTESGPSRQTKLWIPLATFRAVDANAESPGPVIGAESQVQAVPLVFSHIGLLKVCVPSLPNMIVAVPAIGGAL